MTRLVFIPRISWASGLLPENRSACWNPSAATLAEPESFVGRSRYETGSRQDDPADSCYPSEMQPSRFIDDSQKTNAPVILEVAKAISAHLELSDVLGALV